MKGYTLIELMITVAIVGMLAAIIIPLVKDSDLLNNQPQEFIYEGK